MGFLLLEHRPFSPSKELYPRRTANRDVWDSFSFPKIASATWLARAGVSM